MLPRDSNNKKQKHSNSFYLMQYAGLGMQLLAVLGFTVFLGLKTDGWLKLNFPLFAWLLPVAALAGMFYRIVKDTASKK
jgi:hypothetical protein